jgi:hypothetical protein
MSLNAKQANKGREVSGRKLMTKTYHQEKNKSWVSKEVLVQSNYL